ncbi:MAG: hypothetical protein Phyf2KO_22370 [Phycisphaerales bacterium]
MPLHALVGVQVRAVLSIEHLIEVYEKSPPSGSSRAGQGCCLPCPSSDLSAVGPGAREAREPGQGLTAAAISGVCRGFGVLAADRSDYSIVTSAQKQTRAEVSIPGSGVVVAVTYLAISL